MKLANYIAAVLLSSSAFAAEHYQFRLNFETGSPGDQFTLPMVTNSSQCSSPFVLNYTAINNTNVFYIDQTNYNLPGGDGGSRSLRIDMVEGSGTPNVSSLYWKFNPITNIVYGFYFQTSLTNPAGGETFFDTVYFGREYTGTGDATVPVFHVNAVPYWTSHGVISGNPVQHSTGIYGMTTNGLVWVTGLITETNHTLAIYDPSNWSQFGTNAVFSGFSGLYFTQLKINDYSRTSQPGKSTWIDNLVISTNVAEFPMVPGTWDVTPQYVQGLIDAASSGDTVTLPVGSYSWSTNVVISNKALTISGAGTVWITNTQNGNLGSGTNLGGAVAFKVYGTSNGVTRITGINFSGGATNAGNGIYVGGDKWSAVRIDGCTFDRTGHGAIDVGDLVSVLVDSNTFWNCKSTVDTYAAGRLNESWVDALSLGTTNAVVVEANKIHYTAAQTYWDGSTQEAIGYTSQGLGGRSVWRFNAITNQTAIWSRFLDAHGNQQPVNVATQPTISGVTNSHRGTRQVEVYGNTVVTTTSGTLRLTDLRGGTVVMCSNVFLGSGASGTIHAREEDAPYQNGFVSAYPGMDQHRLWMWANTSKGAAVTALDYENAQDADYLVDGVNVFWSAPNDWTPLVYPHPLTGVAPESPESPVVVPAGSARANRVTVGTLRRL